MAPRFASDETGLVTPQLSAVMLEVKVCFAWEGNEPLQWRQLELGDIIQGFATPPISDCLRRTFERAQPIVTHHPPQEIGT